MIKRVLVDTGPLYAILDRKDAHHAACVAALRSIPSPMVTCWPVLTEAAWLLRDHPAAVRRLLTLVSLGKIEVCHADAAAVSWISEFMARYDDLGVQLADACLMYLAEHHGIDTVFTLDRRDFSVFRFQDGRAPTLIPD